MRHLGPWIVGLLNRLDGWFLRIETAICRFPTRLLCDRDGHPIVWTSSNGESGCACGQLREIHVKRRKR